MIRIKTISVLIIISVFLFGCASTGEGYMQQHELMALIKSGRAPVIIDVRSSWEFQGSHVPGAVHVPFWQALTTDKLDAVEKENAIVLYCEHGPRAGVAKLAFSLSGFKHISYLAGHMTAWKKAGLPVE